MAVYILDTLRQKEMAFGVAWATLGLALLAAASGKLFLASEMPGILAALVLLITAACLALTGARLTGDIRPCTRSCATSAAPRFPPPSPSPSLLNTHTHTHART